MDEEKELWNLVRGNLSEKREKEIVEEKIEKKVKEEKVVEQSKDSNETEVFMKEDNTESDFASINLLNEGIFAGVVYIFVIMIVLGILTLPGSLTAAVGGFYGGKKLEIPQGL